jgi:hypothetical protein
MLDPAIYCNNFGCSCRILCGSANSGNRAVTLRITISCGLGGGGSGDDVLSNVGDTGLFDDGL